MCDTCPWKSGLASLELSYIQVVASHHVVLQGINPGPVRTTSALNHASSLQLRVSRRRPRLSEPSTEMNEPHANLLAWLASDRL